jgi:hypothetical protein
MTKRLFAPVYLRKSAFPVSLRSLFLTSILFVVSLAANAQKVDYEKLPFLKPGTTYLWPTNASDYMSATFGETRAAHFHAAIDIGTWGQQGYRVFASRDGLLSRVGVSPSGYGNVVYLKHDDGSFSMYAHLRDFIPQIRELVDSYRFLNYTFNFDRNLESYNIRFQKGDLIAFSGDTGIGPPHLHFELRTPSNNPFNPLLAGISVPDNVPPRISAISVEPLSPDASVNGRKRIVTVPATGSGRNYQFGTIRASGTIGLGVEASDRADALRNVYAVYELKLTINDSLYFHSKADSFEISNARMMFLDRVYPVLRAERKGFQRLFIRDGNKVLFYKNIGHNGTVSLPPGTYNVRIEASDYFGNTSIASGRIQFSTSDHTEIPSKSELSHKSLKVAQDKGLPPDFNRIYWTNDWITNVEQGRQLNIVSRSQDGFTRHSATGPLTDRNFIKLRDQSKQIISVNNHDMVVQRIYPGTKSILRTPDQRLQLEFRESTLYDTMSVAFAWKKENGNIIIETGPDHEPLRTGYIIQFLLDENQKKLSGLGIYSINGSGQNASYSLVGSTFNRGFLQGITTGFGRFTIRQDTVPPEMSRPRIYQRSDGKWFASVRVGDDLSGVDYTTARFEINGVRGIAEYDPFGRLLIYHLPDFRPQARNQFVIQLSDRAGNKATQQFSVSR